MIKKLCVFAFTLAALLFAQALVVPKYQAASPEGALIGEYYAVSGGNDVVFIGDCEVYENFSPAELWRTAGIPSVIRGSPQQTVWQSYWLLEETLRYEIPKAVVFNVLALKYDSPESTGSSERREAYNRMTLDGMRWSSEKWHAVRASLTEEELQHGGVLTYLFPLLRFHSRWQSLTREDWMGLIHREQVSSMGYLMQTGIVPAGEPVPEPPPEKPNFGENSLYWLDRMTALCKARGVELILIKAPSLSPVWWPEWEAQVTQYAERNGLRYYNFLESQKEIGLDWTEDTYDGGLHLNVYGAEKLSRFFAGILAGECGLPDRREDPAVAARWQEILADYDARRTVGGKEGT